MLKQFPELFYSQNSRVLETLVFLALFSRRKVSVEMILIVLIILIFQRYLDCFM